MSTEQPLPPELQERIGELEEQGFFVLKDLDAAPTKFPPAVGSAEWIDALTPAQRERLTKAAIKVGANFATILPALQGFAQAFLPAVAKAFKPLADEISTMIPGAEEDEQ